MDNKSHNGQDPAQGAASAPPVTLEGVKGYLKRDLSCAISLLNAMHSDPEIMNQVALFLYGRWMNSVQHQASLDLQPKHDS